ncbi:MAG TPA: SDR family oxidoreductase [Gemmatimonadales bacterium]|nr:SDR family oxidoreductase [Gemmatimonadales bacterium]
MLSESAAGISPPVVLVTGASTGIGQACAQRLAREGCSVFAGVRRPEDGERLAAASAERVRWLLLDVTNAAQIAAAAETVGRAVDGHGLSGLVNNAGIAIGGPLEFVSAELLRRQLEVNVIGLHAVTTAFLPLIRRARGRIVHVGSISGRIASPLIGPYTASKHAVEALADSLRLELAPEGLHVAVIEPGQVRTPIWDKGLAAFGNITSRIPPEGLVRYGSRLRVFHWMLERAPRIAVPPERVADAVAHALFSAEPRTRYVVGKDARVRLLLARLLPDRLMDALLLAMLGRIERKLT